MFVGHMAVALAAKRTAPTVNVGWFMAGVVALDLVWPVLVIAGIEHVRIVPGATAFTPLIFDSYPWSHSLVMACVWGAVYGGAYFLRTRYARGGWVLFFGVVSHWVLDFVTHRPDMPLWPGGPKVGLGLWYSTGGTIVVESLIYIIGAALYVRATKARDRIGSIGAWSLIVLLALGYWASIVGGAPPSVPAMASGSLIMWLIPFWAAWFDRHRDVAMRT